MVSGHIQEQYEREHDIVDLNTFVDHEPQVAKTAFKASYTPPSRIFSWLKIDLAKLGSPEVQAQLADDINGIQHPGWHVGNNEHEAIIAKQIAEILIKRIPQDTKQPRKSYLGGHHRNPNPNNPNRYGTSTRTSSGPSTCNLIPNINFNRKFNLNPSLNLNLNHNI